MSLLGKVTSELSCKEAVAIIQEEKKCLNRFPEKEDTMYIVTEV